MVEDPELCSRHAFREHRSKRSAAKLLEDSNFVENFKSQWVIGGHGFGLRLDMFVERPAGAGADSRSITQPRKHLNPFTAFCAEHYMHSPI